MIFTKRYLKNGNLKLNLKHSITLQIANSILYNFHFMQYAIFFTVEGLNLQKKILFCRSSDRSRSKSWFLAQLFFANYDISQKEVILHLNSFIEESPKFSKSMNHLLYFSDIHKNDRDQTTILRMIHIQGQILSPIFKDS